MDGGMTGIVACLGTGNVGSSWARLFARAGYDVRVWDARAEQAEACAAMVAELYGSGLVRAVASPAEAMAGAEHVQESISEQPEAKRVLFAEIALLLEADAVLASSTSAIPASQLFDDLTCREQCLVAHPVNPPHLIPLVELSAAPFTARKTVAQTFALMEAVGQKPIEIRGEIPGFALNRLQWALLGEALHLVEGGYCTLEEVDLVLTHGLAPRWVGHGPFANGHLNSIGGLAGYFSDLRHAMECVWSTLEPPRAPSPELVERLHQSLAQTMPVAHIEDHHAARADALARLNAYLADRRRTEQA